MGGASSSRLAADEVVELRATLARQETQAASLQRALAAERRAAKDFRWQAQAAAAGVGVACLVAAVAAPRILSRKVAAARAAAERAGAALCESKLEEARRRAATELRNAEKFAISGLARDILVVADNLEYAHRHASQARDSAKGAQASDVGGVDHASASASSSDVVAAPSSADAEAEAARILQGVVEGVSLTEQSLLDTFGRHGIEKQAPLGARFDPNLHEAVLRVKDESLQDGDVAQVFRSGFTLHERVLRAAQVAVVANPASPAPSPSPSQGERAGETGVETAEAAEAALDASTAAPCGEAKENPGRGGAS
eukprot:TRINITY_DN14378_c0_g1_i2.p1 TRINITY_DN14378_c0_g1~~TRINITY_DN14378_c0_g1_i2.p1  ORF type:complete len:313 (+),score=91.76 TRINITY_DN14378_c0_g1_i2:98-1036(+)